MEYRGQRLLYFTVFVHFVIVRTVRSEDNTVQCGSELCGYQTECTQSRGCQCKSVIGNIGNLEGQPTVKYCLVNCNNDDCPDNTTCVTNTGGTRRCQCSECYKLSPWGQCLGTSHSVTHSGMTTPSINATNPSSTGTTKSDNNATNPSRTDSDTTKPGNNGPYISRNDNATAKPENNGTTDPRTDIGTTKPDDNGHAIITAGSMRLTIGLAGGFGGLLIIVVIVVIILVARRRRTLGKSREPKLSLENQHMPRGTSHVYHGVVDPELPTRATANQVVNVQTAVQVSQTDNTAKGRPTKAGRTGAYEEADIPVDTGPAISGNVVNNITVPISPPAVPNEGQISLRRANIYEEADTMQKTQMNNAHSPIYSVPNKNTKSGLLPKLQNDIYSNHKIKENKEKKKAKTLKDTDGNDLSSENPHHDYNTLYVLHGKPTNENPQNIRPGHTFPGNGTGPNEVVYAEARITDETSTETDGQQQSSGLILLTGNGEYNELKIPKV